MKIFTTLVTAVLMKNNWESFSYPLPVFAPRFDIKMPPSNFSCSIQAREQSQRLQTRLCDMTAEFFL